MFRQACVAHGLVTADGTVGRLAAVAWEGAGGARACQSSAMPFRVQIQSLGL
jgi:hypothetical protein